MVSDVFPSLLLIIRILAAWFGAVLIAGLVWNGIFERTMMAGGASQVIRGSPLVKRSKACWITTG